MKLSEELIERGFIHQIAGPDLATIVDGEKRVVYQGIDPSADSAHAGNMVIWMLLRHLAADGHKIIFLVGGGTGMIGDPKPDAERELRAADEVAANVANLRAQAEQFFAGMEIEFVNNLDWLGELGLLEFLRDVGKHYTVNELIKKDAIATRLQVTRACRILNSPIHYFKGMTTISCLKPKTPHCKLVVVISGGTLSQGSNWCVVKPECRYMLLLCH
jgi:tyrosyl-tRNA synthetase